MISSYNNEEKFNNLVVNHQNTADVVNYPWFCPKGMDQIY
jgi:hypothetical protein